MTNIPFRKKTPSRRNITRSVTKYQDHKPDLEVDFYNRCGYCDASDQWRTTWYELDHFVPKGYLSALSETSYCNLVYSCRSCNNAKRHKWPTQCEHLHHNNKEGFIDPCDAQYDQYFYRDDMGYIYHNGTELGKWMYSALQLHKPRHKVLWAIDTLYHEINDINKMIHAIGGLHQVISSNPDLVVKIDALKNNYIEYTASLAAYK